MPRAQAFFGHPRPATNVSATNVFCRPKWPALTAPTPGAGRPPGPATGVALAETAETPIDAQHQRPGPEGRQAAADKWRRVRLLGVPSGSKKCQRTNKNATFCAFPCLKQSLEVPPNPT
jgi:hypothetical protein